MNFRKLLLNRCQKEFEKDQDDDEIFEKKQKELEASKDVRVIALSLLQPQQSVFLYFCLYLII